jgi:hypothetical protein
VHLTVDPTKEWGKGRNGFADVIIGNSQRERFVPNSVIVMELKNVPLHGLWKSQQSSPYAVTRFQNDYQPMLDLLSKATEEQLLDLKYTYWDTNSKKWVTEQVQDLLRSTTTQVANYINIISSGPAGKETPGIDDTRVSCRDRGDDVLCGYVGICVGARRLICKQVMRTETRYTYDINPTKT